MPWHAAKVENLPNVRGCIAEHQSPALRLDSAMQRQQRIEGTKVDMVDALEGAHEPLHTLGRQATNAAEQCLDRVTVQGPDTVRDRHRTVDAD